MKRAEQATRDLRIVALYREGRTQKSIGEQFAISTSAVQAILKRHGISGRDGGRAKRSAGDFPKLENVAE